MRLRLPRPPGTHRVLQVHGAPVLAQHLHSRKAASCRCGGETEHHHSGSQSHSHTRRHHVLPGEAALPPSPHGFTPAALQRDGEGKRCSQSWFAYSGLASRCPWVNIGLSFSTVARKQICQSHHPQVQCRHSVTRSCVSHR